MKPHLVKMLVAIGVLAARPAIAQQVAHPVWEPGTATWTPAGPGLASSPILGDAGRPGSYAIAFRLAPGAWIPPHSHPAPKQVTVLAGVLLMGSGERLDSAGVVPIRAGQVMVMPAGVVHYEGARVETVVIFSGDGPLITNWVKRP